MASPIACTRTTWSVPRVCVNLPLTMAWLIASSSSDSGHGGTLHVGVSAAGAVERVLLSGLRVTARTLVCHS
jgi:hypothetical protein